MNIILLFALTSYIFDPSLSDWETKEIVEHYQIPPIYSKQLITIKDIPNFIKLYNSGKYKEYIENFEKFYPKFIHHKTSKINYKNLYLYYLIALKIVKSESYKTNISLIKGGYPLYKKIPSFLKKDIKKVENNTDLNLISINHLTNYSIYINGLEIVEEEAYTIGESYNLSICYKGRCRYFIDQKDKNIDVENYISYFFWELKDGRLFSKTIPYELFKYFNLEIIHHFKKNKGEIFHLIQSKDKILTNELINLPFSDSKQIYFTNKKDDLNLKVETPFYKTWYFYTITAVSLVLISGGIYWAVTGEDGGKNTSIIWQ